MKMDNGYRNEKELDEDDSMELESILEQHLQNIQAQATGYKVPMKYYKMVHNTQEQVGKKDE